MSQNTLGFVAAAAGAGVAVKAMELPTSFAGVAAAAVFAVCIGVSSFLEVDVPKPQPKAKKLSKKEKRARAAAANAPAETAADEAAEAAAKAKADKKRAKEQARKKAKRAAAVQEKEDAELKEKETEEAAATEKKSTAAQTKKQKAKAKAKAKKAAAAAAVAAAAPGASASKAVEQKAEAVSAAEPATVEDSPTGWEEVKVKKNKKKVEVDTSSSDKPAFELRFYVAPKHFGLIIGPGGSNLKNLTEATGTSIEIPKDGSINFEILITGPEAGCQRARAAIDQLVAKGFSDITHAGTTDTSVPVPDNKRGIVIGSKGANIKILQEKLGVKINFPEKGSEDDVTVVGDAKAVKEAVAAIESLVKQGFSSLTHENYMNASLEVARDMLKNLIGPKGETIKGLQKSTGVQINVPSDSSGDMVMINLMGETDAINACRVQILELMVPPEPTPISPEWVQSASLQYLDQW